MAPALPSPQSYQTPYGIMFGVLFVVLLVVIFGSYHIVPPGNRGVAVTLGKVDPVERKEGLTFKMPMVTSIVNFPIMQLKADGRAQCFSSDLQTMMVNFTVLYRVPENKVTTLFQQYRGDPYQTLIEPRVQEGMKQVTALFRAEDMVKNREKVKAEVRLNVSKALGDLITLNDLIITNIDLSDQLEQAIEQKVVREQEAFAKQFELDKEKKQAEITIVRAEAEAKSVHIKGEALKVSPEVIQFEIAQRWDGKAPLAVSVQPGGGHGANVLLPLK